MLIDRRNFYDQPIDHLIKQYENIIKVSTGQRDNYATECIIDYAYFIDNCRLIAVDWSKQKALDTAPRQFNK